jgi:multidrug efflux pump subunit AcrB
VNVGNASLNLTWSEDRERTSTEIERSLAPKLTAIPDARVNFQSQSGGGPEGGGGGGRDITLHLGSDDPELLFATANKIAKEMEGLSQVRAPRVQGDLVRPEIIIRPRLDLAADLGVTTQALGQTIRLATIGDIDQNSARFSLNDRQVPIRVMLPESSRRDLGTLENLPVPTTRGGSVPLKSVAEISFGAGPTTVQRTNQVRRTSVGADLAPGLVSGDAWKAIDELPTVKNMPQGVSRLQLGDTKWQGELINNFIAAVVSGILLVFAVLVLLYRRVLVPFVNMGSLLLAPLGAAIALYITAIRSRFRVHRPVMLLGIVAEELDLLVDFAIEEIDRGVEKNHAIMEAGHKRAQPIVMTTVAMVGGHGAGRSVADRRGIVPRARWASLSSAADLLDDPDASDRARAPSASRSTSRAGSAASSSPSSRPARRRRTWCPSLPSEPIRAGRFDEGMSLIGPPGLPLAQER